uniref:AB hydrolase-1 domain-containing protein n=1 Tax=Nelumbo nucifera TaxID=4432 RepID=A0A822Y8S7_NELNU|nr:TPA_asm: hypothetical protein HUJ06_030285 [Nelumbo nucifera]
MHGCKLLWMIGRIAAVLLGGLLSWAYKATRPPPPKICGSPDGPPVTSPRIKLSDGRYLAYKERGVPKAEANYKIIVVHGFDSSKDIYIAASQELIEELGIYFLSFDRAGYGESDPNPKRSVKSEAFDIQELADQLELGSKFYVIGLSMGGYPTWSCLKYIPHRLAGAAMIVPVVNYWWPFFPANLSREVYSKLLVQDQWTFSIAHHAPRLVYWWMTQKWFPSLSALEGHPATFNRKDTEILEKLSEDLSVGQEKIKQQGVFESHHRDLMVGFGDWGFNLLDLDNPFPNNEGSVHIWQGYDDRLVPSLLQCYVAERLPWIQYHEIPDGGHFIMFDREVYESMLKALLLGEGQSAS